MAYVISDECVSCGTCAAECPAEAISEGAEHFEIDADAVSYTHLFFYLLIQAPFRWPVTFCRHPDTQAHDHCTVCKLVHKHNHFFCVAFGICIFSENFLNDSLCLLNICLIGNSNFDLDVYKRQV